VRRLLGAAAALPQLLFDCGAGPQGAAANGSGAEH